MIKSELIQKIADENPHLFQRDVERIVGTVFDEIIEAMAAGHRVELRGFGAFSVKRREARQGRNPRTGDAVTVEEKYVPFFKTWAFIARAKVMNERRFMRLSANAVTTIVTDHSVAIFETDVFYGAGNIFKVIPGNHLSNAG